ncbi:MAG: EsaB/YukD family protein [Clostridiales Family XIII bacterium]|nr:EsaB/YukD family protein [Clostridiales Family XIII bacterium]
MNKILIEIEIPVAQKSFEVFLPLHLTGYEVLGLIVKIATELTDRLFVADDGVALCRKEDGAILNLNQPLWKLGLINSEKLILV